MNNRGYHPELILAELSASDDSKAQQLISHYGLMGEQHTQVYRPQNFGFSSRPPKGSTGMVLSLGGERSRSLFFGGEHDDYRPTGLNEGEGKLYDSSGNLIYMNTGQGISVKAAAGNTIIQTEQGTITIDSKGHAYVNSAGNVYLGTKDGSGAVAVMTVSGPSTRVFAVV